MGFDVIELPVEQPGDWDPHRAADLLAALDLKATVVLAMAPGRTWRIEDRSTLYAELRENLTPVVEYAAANHVRVAVEPLKAAVSRWTPTT